MGNVCNQEPILCKDGSITQSTMRHVKLSQVFRQDCPENEKDFEIGMYFDKSMVGTQEDTLKQWQYLLDGDGGDASRESLQKALNQLHRRDPLCFYKMLNSHGGGRIRWYVWRAVMISNQKVPTVELRPTKQQEVITKDITRTFPNLPYFHKEGLDKLTTLLNMACETFVNLSYTQGMNYVLAFLLAQAGGELNEAWHGTYAMLASPKWMLYGMYIDQFPLMKVLGQLTMELLKMHDIQIYQQFTLLNIVDAYLLTKWCLTCYLYNIQMQAALNFWDVIISKGIFIMALINVQILMQIKRGIMKCKSSEQFLDFVATLPELVLDYKIIKQNVCNEVLRDKLIRQCALDVLDQHDGDAREYLEIITNITQRDKMNEQYTKWISQRIQ